LRRRRLCGISRVFWTLVRPRQSLSFEIPIEVFKLVNMFCRHLLTLFPTYLVIALLRLLWNEGSECVGNRV
jgi:hypothetical protein